LNVEDLANEEDEVEELNDDDNDDEEEEDAEEDDDDDEGNSLAEPSLSSVDSISISQSHSNDPSHQMKAVPSKKAYLSSHSNDNSEIVGINYVSQQSSSIDAEQPTKKREKSDSERATPFDEQQHSDKASGKKVVQNPHFAGGRHSHPSHPTDKINVLVSDGIEILSPVRSPPPLMAPPVKKDSSSVSSTASTIPVLMNERVEPSTSRSPYHVPDNITDSKNYYKNKNHNNAYSNSPFSPPPPPPVPAPTTDYSSAFSPQPHNRQDNDISENLTPVVHPIYDTNSAGCCGKVFGSIFRSGNTANYNYHNVNNNASNARIVPTSPIRKRNMFSEFDEEYQDPPQSDNDPEPESVAIDGIESSENLWMDSDNVVNSEGEEVVDLERLTEQEKEDYYLGKSFVLQVHSEKGQPTSVISQDVVIDDETALEYSMMLQQMQEILQLPSKQLKSVHSKVNMKDGEEGGLEMIKEDVEEADAETGQEEGETDQLEDDDDCFEEASVSFHLSDSEDEEGKEEGHEFLEDDEFEIEEGQEDTTDLALTESPLGKKKSQHSFLTQHFSYSEAIPKALPSVAPTAPVSNDGREKKNSPERGSSPYQSKEFNERGVLMKDDTSGLVKHRSYDKDDFDDQENHYKGGELSSLLKYEQWKQEGSELTERLTDILSSDVLIAGMQFLSSSEMIDESLNEDEVLLKLESILGIENLTYLEEMYQLMNYQQLIIEYESTLNA
jgi:hypothetical protein